MPAALRAWKTKASGRTSERPKATNASAASMPQRAPEAPTLMTLSRVIRLAMAPPRAEAP